MVVPRTLPTMQRSTKTLMTPDEWDIAACRYHPKELWFPEAANHKVNYLKAKHICNTCPVQQPCLKAGQSEVFGMWGRANTSRKRLWQINNCCTHVHRAHSIPAGTPQPAHDSEPGLPSLASTLHKARHTQRTHTPCTRWDHHTHQEHPTRTRHIPLEPPP